MVLVESPQSKTALGSRVASAPAPAIWREILTEAMTGALVSASHYEKVSEICNDPREAADALERADCEWAHANRFAAEGRKLGVNAVANVHAGHWKHPREIFARAIEQRDLVSARIIQAVMLDSLAAASYKRAAEVAPASLAAAFNFIARQAHEHIDLALARLKAERAAEA